MFVHSESMQPVPDGEDGARERLRLRVQLRPLIGWTSVEGGFSGLYYNEMYGRLHTAVKITQDAPGFHLGDICTGETPMVRVLLINNVLRAAAERHALYSQEFEIELTEEATLLFVKKRVPLPRMLPVGEE